MIAEKRKLFFSFLTWHEEHPDVQALQGLGELSCSDAQTTPVPREGSPSDHTLLQSAPLLNSCSLVTYSCLVCSLDETPDWVTVIPRRHNTLMC